VVIDLTARGGRSARRSVGDRDIQRPLAEVRPDRQGRFLNNVSVRILDPLQTENLRRSPRARVSVKSEEGQIEEVPVGNPISVNKIHHAELPPTHFGDKVYNTMSWEVIEPSSVPAPQQATDKVCRNRGGELLLF
jgi:hypothetical protein